MSTSKKRLSITLQPEWEPVMDKLKKDKFYDKPYSNVIRHLIELGLKAVKALTMLNIAHLKLKIVKSFFAELL